MNKDLIDLAEDVCGRAVKAYGRESQICMAVGECGEFLTLIGRQAQGRATDDAWIDEIADVFIMMLQMRSLWGETLVDDRIREKLIRLSSRLRPSASTPEAANVPVDAAPGQNRPRKRLLYADWEQHTLLIPRAESPDANDKSLS